MKPPRSKLIDAFLSDLEKGLITAHEDSTAPSTLQAMGVALATILDGENPEAALGITRQAGAPADLYNEALAIKIHNLRTAGVPWAAIEAIFKKEFTQRGRKTVLESNLKRIYKKHFPAKQYERVMRERNQAFEIQQKRKRALFEETKREANQKKK